MVDAHNSAFYSTLRTIKMKNAFSTPELFNSDSQHCAAFQESKY